MLDDSSDGFLINLQQKQNWVILRIPPKDLYMYLKAISQKTTWNHQ